jgi:AcrR family transcriptional regulator
MTVGDITEAVGITRGALYFYFASKQDVLTALDRTVQLWREHGVVMRSAVDLSSTAPEIDQLWTGTADVSSKRSPRSSDVAACRPVKDQLTLRHWDVHCAG